MAKLWHARTDFCFMTRLRGRKDGKVRWGRGVVLVSQPKEGKTHPRDERSHTLARKASQLPRRYGRGGPLWLTAASHFAGVVIIIMCKCFVHSNLSLTPCLCPTTENLTPAGESVSRVPLNASDRDLAESLPLIRDILNRNDPSKSSSTGVPPPHPAPPSTPVQASSEGGSQPVSVFFTSLFLFMSSTSLILQFI